MAHFQVPWVSLLNRFDYISQFMKIFRHSQNANCDFSTFLTMQIYWMFCLLCIKFKLWRCTRYNIIWSSLSVTCDRSVVFSGTPVSSTNKTDRHDITEILLQVAESTITPTRSGPLPECFGCYVYRFKLIMLSYSTDQIVSK